MELQDKVVCLQRIIENLEHVKQRPGMFVGANDDVNLIDVFLSGSAVACHALGIRFDYQRYAATVHSNGYETRANVGYVYEQMREHGLSETEIVQERLRFEIETYRALLEELATEAEGAIA
jgi:hypothetical protein